MNSERDPVSSQQESDRPSKAGDGSPFWSVDRFLKRLLKPQLSLLDLLLMTAYCSSFVLALLLTYFFLSSSLVPLFLA